VPIQRRELFSTGCDIGATPLFTHTGWSLSVMFSDSPQARDIVAEEKSAVNASEATLSPYDVRPANAEANSASRLTCRNCRRHGLGGVLAARSCIPLLSPYSTDRVTLSE
jgi:hypothetical protein